MQGSEAEKAVRALLEGHTAVIRDLAGELRAHVLATVPESAEAVRTGWHALIFRHPIVGHFCGIFPRDAWVDLVLEWGVLLDDPDALFNLRGNQVATVRVLPGQEWDRAAVARCLRAALALPAQRAVRVMMARERSSENALRTYKPDRT